MEFNLYDKKVYVDVKSRIEKLSNDSLPLWGKMNIAQMMAHCSEVLDVYNGVKPLKSNFFTRLFKGYIRKVVIGPEPYKKNSPTAPQFKISAHKEFSEQKTRLINSLNFFYEMQKEEAENIDHSLFGKMSLDERGWAMFKHLNHHLEQFGG